MTPAATSKGVYRGPVVYHWEWLSADQVALYEEGYTWTGVLTPAGIAAAVNKMGPFLGVPKVTYQAAGPLVDPPQTFDSFEEAMQAVETIVRDRGGSIQDR